MLGREGRGEGSGGTRDQTGVRMWGAGEHWRLEEGIGAVCGQKRFVRTKVGTHLSRLGHPCKSGYCVT